MGNNRGGGEYMKEKLQSIVFAYYKGDKCLGYRQDTIGSIGMSPKIYQYSKEQVEICLKNIRSNVDSGEGFGKMIMKALGQEGHPQLELVAQKEQEVYDDLQEARGFEVRVTKCPQYGMEFDVQTAEWRIDYGSYPREEMQEWLKYPEIHEVIEVHPFTLAGQLNMN